MRCGSSAGAYCSSGVRWTRRYLTATIRRTEGHEAQEDRLGVGGDRCGARRWRDRVRELVHEHLVEQPADEDRRGRGAAEPDCVGRLYAARMGEAVRKADGLRR